MRDSTPAPRARARLLAIAAIVMLVSGCHPPPGRHPSRVTAEEDRQLDQAAADLDANSVDSNAVDANAESTDGDESQ